LNWYNITEVRLGNWFGNRKIEYGGMRMIGAGSESNHAAVMAASFPAQCREAYELVENTDFTAWTNIKAVVLCGMGGSGIGGDLFHTIFADKLYVPSMVCKQYILPRWVDADTVVMISSYSGNTEETMVMYDIAKEKQAHIVCITAGGWLKQQAERDGYPVITVPGGLIPRAATGYLFTAVMLTAVRLGLIDDVSLDFEEAVTALEELQKEIDIDQPLAVNWLKQMAEQLQGRFPVVYGMGATGEVAAYRWRCQFNEYSKIPALSHGLPEMCHNEIVGWERFAAIIPNVIVIILEDELAHPRNNLRLKALREILNNVPIIHVAARGKSTLARMLTLVFIGDMLSIYLAMADNVNPMSIRHIDYLKERMQEEV
jgi:glucose/mannose-6-phosphate isomerase